MYSTGYCCQILMNFQLPGHFFEKYKNTRFHENSSSGSRGVPHGRKDMMEPVVAFRNFAKAPRNGSKRIFGPDSV